MLNGVIVGKKFSTGLFITFASYEQFEQLNRAVQNFWDMVYVQLGYIFRGYEQTGLYL